MLITTFWRIVSAVSALLVAPSTWADQAADQQVTRNISFEYFLVSGVSLDAVAHALSERGPNGHWAQTEWTVNWSKSCEVSVDAVVTFPRVMGTRNLSSSDRQRLDAMLVALRAHEMQHVYIGIFAAEEISRRGCRDTAAISKYWKSKNRELDIRTKRGKSEGVTLSPARLR